MRRRETYKRPFDLALLLLALLLLLPIWLPLALAIALAIRLDDGGPVLFRQARLGRGGRIFQILKFRTMAVDAEERFGPRWAAWNDHRATRAGQVLRRFHLDELPQAVNVLRGEMSLVGPRPERPGRAERIARSLPAFRRRLAVRPGIAGLAQARGGHDIDPRNKLRYDLLYLGAMNPGLDLRLCAACLARALRGSPAPAGARHGRGCVPPLPRTTPPAPPVSEAPKPAAETAPAGAPPPVAVRGNDWRAVDGLPDSEAFAPTLAVSVVVPCFEAPEALALTLAGLEGQRYPRDLFEVVVVDDGSSPPLRIPDPGPVDVRLVRREGRGFGLAAARNAGARAARHDILVFLDGDVVAEAGLLAAHARWHHRVPDALTLGFCAYVSTAGLDAAAVRSRKASLADLLAGRPWDPPWLDRHMARTGDLTSRHDDLFRAVTGHNFAIRKAFFEEAGGFDESFDRYGGEDTEFGYRIWCRGGLLVPARDAFGWHQGRWSDGRERKERDQDLQAAKLAELIPDPGFRRFGRGPVFTVPRHVATVEAGATPAAGLRDMVDRLLADPADDLAVRVETPPGRTDGRRIRELLGGDPRVSVGAAGTALDACPHSPFHFSIPAGAALPRGLAPRLRAALGGRVAAAVVLPDGSRVTAGRTWALHRARRAGGRPEDYGTSRTVRLPRLPFLAGRRRGRGDCLAERRRSARAAAARRAAPGGSAGP